MNSGYLDITGATYGRLRVLSKTDLRAPDGSVKWECLCQCGNICTVSGTLLRRGSTVSCGCKLRDVLKRRAGRRKKPKRVLYFDAVDIDDIHDLVNNPFL